MYCNNCGNEIGSEVAFCPHCGSEIQKPSVITVQNFQYANTDPLQMASINQDTVNAIERLLNPLKQIAEINQKLAYLQISQRKSISSSNNAIGILIGGFAIGLIIGYFFKSVSDSAFWVVFLLFGVTGTLLFLFKKMTSKSRINKLQKEIDNALMQINDVCQYIDENDIKVLPPDYRFYDAAAFFHHAFINQRALTMQQAVNLYEDELRKDQMAQLQKAQMEYLGEIRTTSSISATMSTLNFISRLF